MYTADRISWWNPRVLSVLLLVFCTGGVAGALTFRLVKPLLTRAIAPIPANNKEAFLQRLEKELSLRPDQSKQMSMILDDYKRYYQSINEQLEEVRATGKNRILDVLDAEQKQKFQRMTPDLPK